jgi:hypothetical protein
MFPGFIVPQPRFYIPPIESVLCYPLDVVGLGGPAVLDPDSWVSVFPVSWPILLAGFYSNLYPQVRYQAIKLDLMIFSLRTRLAQVGFLAYSIS